MPRKQLESRTRPGADRTRRWLVAAGMLVLAGLHSPLGCRPGSKPGESAEKPGPAAPASPGAAKVFVSILPQAYFVERVGGAHVDVHVLVGPGQSPASYEPTPDQMTGLAEARVLFRVGVPFEEALLPKVRRAFPELEIADTREGITLRRVEAEHEEHTRHQADGDDPHIWLSPKLVKIQARTIRDVLCRIDPEHADDYQKNLAALLADLDALDARLAAALAPLRGRDLFVFHPAYGYFADAYGLKQVAVEIEGKDPSPQEVAALIERARRAGVRVIFVQPQFSSSNAEVIASEIGGAVVPLDPLARDYIRNLEAMAQRVREALSGE